LPDLAELFAAFSPKNGEAKDLAEAFRAPEIGGWLSCADDLFGKTRSGLWHEEKKNGIAYRLPPDWTVTPKDGALLFFSGNGTLGLTVKAIASDTPNLMEFEKKAMNRARDMGGRDIRADAKHRVLFTDKSGQDCYWWKSANTELLVVLKGGSEEHLLLLESLEFIHGQ
jgi:hypothetical protein